MRPKDSTPKQPGEKPGEGPHDNLAGYPHYPPDEDIYRKGLEEKDIDPEDIFTARPQNEKDTTDRNTDLEFNTFVAGSDLDVPGSELDDEQEKIGNEDEENNYYSIGGDAHSNLDED